MSALRGAAEAAVLVYFLLLNVHQLAFLLLALRAARRSARERAYPDLAAFVHNPLLPPVSVVLRAAADPSGLAAAVTELLELNYPRFEVVVVCDAPGALEALKGPCALTGPSPEEPGALKTARVRGVHASKKHENLVVLDKEPAGEADALNAGLNAAQHPYFLALASDDRLEPDAVLRLVREVLEAPVRAVAVGGAVRASNGCRKEGGRIRALGLGANPLLAFQTVEYFRAGVAPAAAFSALNGLMGFAGGPALYERDVVASVGGFRAEGVGGDYELLTRLHRRLRDGGERDFSVRFVAEPVCWTPLPETLPELARRTRARQSALLGTIAANDGFFYEQRYGALGTFTAPYLLVFEGWGAGAEALGYALLLARLAAGDVSAPYVSDFLSLAVVGGAGLAVAGVALGEAAHRRYPSLLSLAALAAAALLEGACFRPLTAAMRLVGVVDHLRTRRAPPPPLPGAAAPSRVS